MITKRQTKKEKELKQKHITNIKMGTSNVSMFNVKEDEVIKLAEIKKETDRR